MTDAAKAVATATAGVFSYSDQVEAVTRQLASAFRKRERKVDKPMEGLVKLAGRGMPGAVHVNLSPHQQTAAAALSSISEIRDLLVAGLKRKDTMRVEREALVAAEQEATASVRAAFAADVKAEREAIEAKFQANTARLQVLYAPPRTTDTTRRPPIPAAGLFMDTTRADAGGGGSHGGDTGVPASGAASTSPVPDEPEHVTDEVEKLLALVRTKKDAL